jgi:hypothetical protein
MSTDARIRAVHNRRRPCDLPGCRYRRSFTSRWCCNHADNLRQYGHPLARHIFRREYEGHVKYARRFLTRHAQHPAVIAALEVVDGLLQPGHQPAVRRLSEHYQLWKELVRLERERLQPREVLDVILGLFLFSCHNPRVLPDDQRLTYALANAVFRCRPLYSRKQWTGTEVKSIPQPPGALAVGLLGNRLRDALAPFVGNVLHALEVEYRAEERKARQLKVPFVNATA